MLGNRLYLLITVFVLTSGVSVGQQYAVDLFAGTSNYQGDMMEKRYSMRNSKMVLGIGGSYILNGHFRVRGLISLAKLGANDQYATDPSLIARNLNFSTSLTELSLTVHYDLLDLDYFKFTPYLFGGVAVFHFNPYTNDSVYGKVFLKPLSTEGQGLALYPDRKPYSLTQISFPIGAGIRFRVNDNIAIAWEVGLRKTNTDYLDDLSTTYVDQAYLLSQKGQVAVDLAYRGDEVKNNPGVYPADGTVRGGASYKDWYYFSGVTATFKVNAGKAARDAMRGSTGCPKGF